MKTNHSISNYHSGFESKLIDACLVSSVLGCFISIAFVGLSHVLIIISLIYILYRKNKINYSLIREPSIVSLIFLVAIIIATLVVNYDMVSNFSNSVLKIKYFILPIIIIVFLRSIKLKPLFFFTVIFAIVSSIYGTIELLTNDLERNRGLIGSAMSFSHNLSLFTVLFLGIGIYNLKRMNRSYLILFSLITFIFIYTMYSTKTRGAWVSLSVGVYLIIYMQVNKRKLIISLTFTLIIALGMLWRMDKLTFITEYRKGSNDERLQIAKEAVEITCRNPFLGVGYRQFECALNTSGDEETLKLHPQVRGHAHNLYLEYSATTGILGLLAFLSWMFLWGKKLWNDKNTRMISIPVFACILASGLTHYNFGDGENLTLIMLLFTISHIYTRDNAIESYLPIQR